MGSFRSQPETKKQTVSKTEGTLSYAVSHMCGWRLYMEDAHISIVPFGKQVALFGVFDGHGGAQVSTFVERHFAQQLKSNQNFKKNHYQQALRETFMKMDQMLRTQKGKQEIKKIQKEMREKNNAPNYEDESHAGCTANVVLITKQYVYCANSGDSRAVGANSKIEPVQLSVDHKPQDKKQIDRIEKAGGTVSYGRVNGNLNLSRAIGDLQYKNNSALKPQQQMITADPQITKVNTDKLQFIIMGCDGIWEVKSNSDMVKWVNKRLTERKQLGSILEELLDELVAKDSGGEYGMDNMSSILIKFKK